MSWTDENIADHEEIVFSTRKHWSVLLMPLSLVPMVVISMWVLIISLGFLIYSSYSYFSHYFVVTNKRIILKQGIYYIRLQDWPLHKIDDVIFTQSFGDNIWRKGTVILMGMAMPKVRLKDIGNPQTLRDAIYSQLPTT